MPSAPVLEAEPPLAADYENLINQLVPAEPSPRRRLGLAFVVVSAALGFGVVWRIGVVVPEPTAGSTTIQTVSMQPTPDGDQVRIDWLIVDSTSLTTLEVGEIDVDAPGLTIDRITWFDGVDGPAGENRSLPAVLQPGGSINVTIWARPETCVDPTGVWGSARVRWEYPDRPSWWGRWESLDNPLWNPDSPAVGGDDTTQSALVLNPTTNVDGEIVNLDGPLSGACKLLGIEQ